MSSDSKASKSYLVRLSAADRRWVHRRLNHLKNYFDQRIADQKLDRFNVGFLSLFYFLYSRQFSDAAAFEIAVQLRDHTETVVLTERSVLSILQSPFEGFIVLQIWKDLGFPAEYYEQLRPKINQAISRSVRPAMHKTTPELLYGDTGLALAAVHQGHLPLLKLCLRSIDKKWQETPWGFGYLWSDPSSQYGRQVSKEQPTINLGLSHGIVGPLLLLSYLRDSGQKNLGRAIASLEKTLMKIEKLTRSQGFPPIFPLPEAFEESPLQSGWCYGDPGVGIALLRSLPKKKWAFAEKILLRGTDPKKWRRPIRTETFCHGAAGLAQICLRHYQRTGNAKARRNYMFWLRKLDRSPGRYQFLRETMTEPRLQDGLLNGYLGIGMTLLSAIVEDDVAWDRYFLLSSPIQKKMRSELGQ